MKSLMKKAKKIKVELESGRDYAGVAPYQSPEETTSYDLMGNPITTTALPK